jgi:hypothetical protein
MLSRQEKDDLMTVIEILFDNPTAKPEAQL